jgi:hypothetical protein
MLYDNILSDNIMFLENITYFNCVLLAGEGGGGGGRGISACVRLLPKNAYMLGIVKAKWFNFGPAQMDQLWVAHINLALLQ